MNGEILFFVKITIEKFLTFQLLNFHFKIFFLINYFSTRKMIPSIKVLIINSEFLTILDVCIFTKEEAENSQRDS